MDLEMEQREREHQRQIVSSLNHLQHEYIPKFCKSLPVLQIIAAYNSIYSCFLVLISFSRQYELSANHRRRKDFVSLPLWQQDLLPDYLDMLSDMDAKIIQNALFLNKVATQTSDMLFSDEDKPSSSTSGHSSFSFIDADHEKLRSSIRQLVRDWSEEGAAERNVSYQSILAALGSHFSSRNFSDLNVLVPGCGLGRLVWELARLGYNVQGNEVSWFMLILSNFILNTTAAAREHKLFPYVHSLTNVVSADDVVRPYQIPDVLPTDLPDNANMSMTAGDFVEVYSKPSHKGQWDAILTCFFIDTASNVIEYLTTIKHCLAKDGIWINLGPLLWHHVNSETEKSIEMTLEDVKGLAGRLGFHIENERFVQAAYTGTPNSMLSYVYNASFFTATKSR